MFVCRVSGWLARDYSFKELNTMNLHLSGNSVKKINGFHFCFKHKRQVMPINVPGARWELCFSFLFHYGLCLLNDAFACLCVWVLECVYLCVCVEGGVDCSSI